MRAPDVAFVRRERIEVVSPHDKLYEVDEKVDDFLAAGSQVVCIVYPKRRTATVHHPDREPEILTVNETLDVSDVVPGFTIAVSNIFA